MSSNHQLLSDSNETQGAESAHTGEHHANVTKNDLSHDIQYSPSEEETILQQPRHVLQSSNNGS